MMKMVLSTLRAPIEVHRRMAEHAKKHRGSVNSHIVKAMEYYLDQENRKKSEESVEHLAMQIKMLQKEVREIQGKLKQ